MENSLDFQINDLIARSRAGDDDAFSTLVTRYKPMLTAAAVRFGLSPEEYFSEACVGLYRAILTYDLSKSEVTFGLYAKICVTRRLSDALRREKATSDRITIIDGVDVDSIAVSDRTLMTLIDREERESFRTEAKRILSDYEYRVLGLWLSGLSVSDIGEELHTDSKSVENAKGRIIKKLRAALNPKDPD